MKVIDAQVHIWAQTIVAPNGGHRQVSSFGAEELLAEMDEAGVDAGLIHPPASWDPTSVPLAMAAAQKYPDRFAVMGQFPPGDRSNEALLPGWRQQPGMLGIRLALHTPDENYTPPGELDRLLLLHQTGDGRPGAPMRIPGDAGFVVQ